MADASLRVSAPTLAVVDGHPTTTSIDVARHFGKQHRDVLRAIEGLIAQLPAEHLRNFAQVSYEVDQTNGGKASYPMYRLTRDGFTLLAMGFTGKRALQFKLAYIDAFNRMEAELRNASHPPTMVITQKPSEDQVREAMNMGLAMAAFVQQSVARVVLRGGDDWRHKRWLVSFVTDSKYGAPPVIEEIASDAHVVSQAQMSAMLADAAVTAWDRILGGIRAPAGNSGSSACNKANQPPQNARKRARGARGLSHVS